MSRRAIIIEDDPVQARLLIVALGWLGYDPEAVHTGAAGIEAIERATPELVTLDLNLGSGIQGVDVLRWIRERPEYDMVRVVVVSGEEEAAAIAISGKADAVLLKPVTLDDLRETVEALGGSRAP